MRKLFVACVLAFVCIIAGFGIFSIEASQIKTKVSSIHGNKVTYSKVMDDSVKQIDLASFYTGDVSANSTIQLKKDGNLNLTDIQEDSSIDPNSIEITYSDVFDLVNNNSSEKQKNMAYHFELKEDDKNQNSDKLAQAAVNTWNKKSMDIEKVDHKDKKVKIRYGSNLKDKINIYSTHVTDSNI
jgi:hypothetical protein